MKIIEKAYTCTLYNVASFLNLGIKLYSNGSSSWLSKM